MKNPERKKHHHPCYRNYRYLIFGLPAVVTLVSCWYNALTLQSTLQSPLQIALLRSKPTRTRIKKPASLVGESGRLKWSLPNSDGIDFLNPGEPEFARLVQSISTYSAQNAIIQPNTTVCVNGTLPPFRHVLPNFVPGTKDKDLFLLQPENTNSMSPDWMDTSWETCFVFFPLEHENNSAIVTARIVGVQSFWFQHFHDNALSFLYQARQGLDAVLNFVSTTNCRFEERILYERPARGSEILHEEWSMLGFPKERLYPTTRFKEVTSRDGGVSIVRKRYPRDADQVRLHPTHAQWFQSNLPQPTKQYPQQKRIIWISRQGAQLKGTFARQCTNENAVIARLNQTTGQGQTELTLYNPSAKKLTTVSQLVDYFADVCAIVGIHGGGLYNQFFATHSEKRAPTNIIELFPVNDKGLIHGQMTNRSTPQLAHRSIWHNSNALGQPYWRIHFAASNSKAFDVPLTAMDSVLRALKLAECVE